MPTAFSRSRPAEFVRHHSRMVRCPHEAIPATITAGMSPILPGREASWSVVRCSLVPSGSITCDMRCLGQLDPATAEDEAGFWPIE